MSLEPIQICAGDPIFKIWFAKLDRTSTPEHLFQGKGQTTIDNDLIRGMSKEIYSLQSIAHKFQKLENSVERRFAEQKPIIDNLTSFWQSLQTGLIIAVFAGLLTIALPTLYRSGVWVKDQLYSESDDATPAEAQQ